CVLCAGRPVGENCGDLGCGSGKNLIPLIQRGAQVIGIDLSPELIELARARLAEAALHADLCIASAYETKTCRKALPTWSCVQPSCTTWNLVEPNRRFFVF